MKEILRVFKEILDYMWKTKKWWIVPLICVLFILGLLIIMSSTAPVPVFVYPLV